MSADLPHPDPGGGGGGLQCLGGGGGQGQRPAQQPRLHRLDLAPHARGRLYMCGGQHPAPRVHKHQAPLIRARDPGSRPQSVADLPQPSEHVLGVRNGLQRTSDNFV